MTPGLLLKRYVKFAQYVATETFAVPNNGQGLAVVF